MENRQGSGRPENPSQLDQGYSFQQIGALPAEGPQSQSGHLDRGLSAGIAHRSLLTSLNGRSNSTRKATKPPFTAPRPGGAGIGLWSA